MHVFRNGQAFNDTTANVRGLRNHPVIHEHEHDFTTVTKAKKEPLYVCSSCGSVYCARSGKLIK